jgi:hypothetical protein
VALRWMVNPLRIHHRPLEGRLAKPSSLAIKIARGYFDGGAIGRACHTTRGRPEVHTLLPSGLLPRTRRAKGSLGDLHSLPRPIPVRFAGPSQPPPCHAQPGQSEVPPVGRFLNSCMYRLMRQESGQQGSAQRPVNAINTCGKRRGTLQINRPIGRFTTAPSPAVGSPKRPRRRGWVARAAASRVARR